MSDRVQLDAAGAPFWERARGDGPTMRAMGCRHRFARLAEIRGQLVRLEYERYYFETTGGRFRHRISALNREIAALEREALRLDHRRRRGTAAALARGARTPRLAAVAVRRRHGSMGGST